MTIGGKLIFHIIFTGEALPDLQVSTEGNGNHVLTPISSTDPRSGPAAPGLEAEERMDISEAASLAQCAVAGAMYAMQVLEWEGLKRVPDYLEGASFDRMENIRTLALWIDPDCGDLAMAFASGAFDAWQWKLGGAKPAIPKRPPNQARDEFETDATSGIIAMLQNCGGKNRPSPAGLAELAQAYHADALEGHDATH